MATTSCVTQTPPLPPSPLSVPSPPSLPSVINSLGGKQMSTSTGSKKQTNVLVFRAAGGREVRVGRAGSQVWHYHGHDDHDDGGDDDDDHHDGGDNHGDDGDNCFGDFLILRV